MSKAHLPNNTELERQLIGQSLLDGKLSATELKPSDFYSPIWSAAWASIIELEASGKPIDAFAVTEAIKQRHPSFTIKELVDASTGLITSDNTDQWTAEIKNLAVRRYLIRQFAAQIKTLESSADYKDVISELEFRFDQIRTEFGAKDERFVSLSQIVDEDIKPALDDLHDHKTKKISTGFLSLDRCIGGGISLSDVCIVAGLPGGGKSAFVLQLAFQLAKQNYPVAFLSGEMTNRENGLRLLSQVSNFLNLNAAMHISADERELLVQWADAIKDVPMYFDHRTSDLTTLAANVRSLVKRKGVKVLVVDYIQLLKVDKIDKRMRHERITEASQELKRLANELNIAIIEVAQFNREGAKSGEPSMHDLEASGQLEKDSSIIMILDRKNDDEDVTLRIVKGRNVGKATLPGRFYGSRLRFEF